MAQELTTNRLLLDIIPIATSTISEEELINRFTSSVSSIYGVEKVFISDMKKKEEMENALEGYIRNTKKPIIDNQLSEYSTFAEFIGYRNNGYHSCAVIPLVADGKVFSLLQMLSVKENKFSEEIVSNVTFGASFLAFVLMYKGELGRSVRLATYFDAAFNNPIPQFVVSEDGTIIKVNKAAMKSFEVIGADRRKINDILSMDFKSLMTTANGTFANVSIEQNKNQKVYAIAASRINDKLLHVAAQDMTEQLTYVAVSETFSLGNDVCSVATDGALMITNVSANAERMLGYARSMLSNGNLIDFVAKGEQKDFKSVLDRIEKKGGHASGSVTLDVSGLGQRYFHFTARRFINGYLIVLVKADLEKYIDNTRKDLEDFISNSSDGLLGIDGMGYIRDCNVAAEVITGYRKEELIGREVKSLYVEQDLLDRDIKYVRNGSKVDNTSITITGKNAEQVPAIHSVRLFNGGPDETGVEFIIILKELATKRKLSDMEQMLKKQERLLGDKEAEGQLKSQFIYNISHELKTPLTNIKGYSKLLYDGDYGKLNDEQKDYIKTTLDEADRLMLIIQQILDAAKLDSKKVKLEFKDVDLKNMVNNPSIKALEESALGKGLKFEWKVDYDIPEKISADPNRLIQIFVNLIGNAIKFTEKGSITVHISRLNKKSAKSIVCKVIDTGIGINDEDKKRIGKRKFYQAVGMKKDLTQQPGAGTGLGLSITRELIGLHGGKLSVDSKLGEGSTFWFNLPTSQKPKKKEQQQQDDKKSAPASAAGLQ